MDIKGLFLRYCMRIITMMLFAGCLHLVAFQAIKKTTLPLPAQDEAAQKKSSLQPAPLKGQEVDTETEEEEPTIEYAEEETVEEKSDGKVQRQVLTAAQTTEKQTESEDDSEDAYEEEEEVTEQEVEDKAALPDDETRMKSTDLKIKIAHGGQKTEIIKPTTKKRSAKKDSDDDDYVEFHFENADLRNLVTYMSDVFNVTFIADDIINPMGPGGKAIGGNKITFNTQKPLSKKEAWSLFTTFLDIAGLAVIPGTQQGFYRIVATEAARKSAISSFIGVDAQSLPDNDTMVRYVYFIENSSPDTMKNIVDSLRSSASSFIILQEMKAFILTDKSYNIKSLMKIVKELDKVSMPQAMSILKLRRADALQVQKLYADLVPGGDAVASRLFGQRKPSGASYLPENVRIIAESRTNTLILLGPQDAIKKIEDFVVKHIDVDLDVPYSPLYVYPLKYADAANIADIMNNVTQFGQGTEVARTGGVRGEDKYLKPLLFIPEKENNRLIIKGEYDDYLRAKEVIEKLDEAQPQVAIEVLIVTVDLNDSKKLGGQLRNKLGGPTAGALGKNVNVQTSGFNGQRIVEDTAASGSMRLLGDLISLVTNASAGNTIMSLGSDAKGVWGIFGALQTLSNTQVVSNPFLIATNKTEATVTLGETRRVITGIVKGQTDTNTFNDSNANLTVRITPQINSDGMILLDLDISIDEFVNADDASNNAAKTKKNIKTKTIVANKEVMALGGLIKNKLVESVSKTPILGDIPLLGWLFKNKSKNIVKDDLLILLSTRIIEPESKYQVTEYTKKQTEEYQSDVDLIDNRLEKRDPIERAFFMPAKDSTDQLVDDFIFERERKEEDEHKGSSKLVKKKLINKKVNVAIKEQKQPIKVAQVAKKSRATLTDFFEEKR